MIDQKAIITIRNCQALINSSTEESLLSAIDSVSREGMETETAVPDLTDLLRLVACLKNYMPFDGINQDN